MSYKLTFNVPEDNDHEEYEELWQECPLRYKLLEHVGTKTYNAVTNEFKCRDYFNDVVTANTYGIRFCAYEMCFWPGMCLAPNNSAVIALSDCDEEGNVRMPRLLEHIKTFLNPREKMLGLRETTLDVTDSETEWLLRFDRKYLYSNPTISGFTQIVRILYSAACHDLKPTTLSSEICEWIEAAAEDNDTWYYFSEEDYESFGDCHNVNPRTYYLEFMLMATLLNDYTRSYIPGSVNVEIGDEYIQIRSTQSWDSGWGSTEYLVDLRTHSLHDFGIRALRKGAGSGFGVWGELFYTVKNNIYSVLKHAAGAEADIHNFIYAGA